MPQSTAHAINCDSSGFEETRGKSCMAVPETDACSWKKPAAGHSTDVLAISGSFCSFCSRQPPRSAIQHCGGPFFQANDCNDYDRPLAGAGASEHSKVGCGRRQPGSSGCVRRNRCCRCYMARHPGWRLRTWHRSLPQRCKAILQHRLERNSQEVPRFGRQRKWEQ